MLRPSAIALIFAALQFSLSVANIQTRDGKTVSGSLQQLSEQGVWVNGQTFSWGIIRKADLAPAPAAKAELREVKTKIWRGSSTTFMEVLTRDPSTIDDVNRRLGRTPVAILFEGRLNAPRAGDYQFRLATDKAQQDKQTAAIKAPSDSGNNLRDARYRAGAKEREGLEAVFQHERYRVQKRAVLGFA